MESEGASVMREAVNSAVHRASRASIDLSPRHIVYSASNSTVYSPVYPVVLLAVRRAARRRLGPGE